jgi:pSer/pThr/pTyr-binding forkhead associated (FHA) protein
MNERTQPAYGVPAPQPAIIETAKPTVTPDRLGTRLVGVEGLYTGHTFSLVGETTLLGREPENGVALTNDPTVSRVHARIVLEEAGHTLYDEGSSNGTYVNGVLVGNCVLAPGDMVQLGSSRLRYE